MQWTDFEDWWNDLKQNKQYLKAEMKEDVNDTLIYKGNHHRYHIDENNYTEYLEIKVTKTLLPVIGVFLLIILLMVIF